MKNLKRIFQDENGKIKNIAKKEGTLKVTAFLIALVVFISINQLGSPIWKEYFQSSTYIDGIPLEVVYDHEKYVVEGLPETVAVNVSGSSSNVETVERTKNNLVATLKIPHINPGEYEINTNQIEFNTVSNVSVEPVASSFNITLQNYVEENRAVDITYIEGQNSSQEFLLNTPKLSHEEVQVVGGSNDVGSVVTVMGMINLSELNPTEDKSSTFMIDLIAYDKEGRPMNDVSLYPNQIEVTQPYDLQTITVPVNYGVINNETGKYVSKICDADNVENCDVQQESIQLYGDREKIESLSEVNYVLDLENFTGQSGVVKSNIVLESGVYVYGDERQEFYVELEEGTSKTIEDVSLMVSNLQPNLQAKAQDISNTKIDVTVTGAKSVVEEVTKESIVLAIDMADISKPGTYQLPILIRKQNNLDYKLEQEEITIEIMEA